MDQELLGELMSLSAMEIRMEQEKAPVLSYYVKEPDSDVIDRDRVIRPGLAMDILRHVRFVEFPDHRHNYVEAVYMYHGRSCHMINRQTRVELEAGDLLLLKQGTSHSVKAAGWEDIAVHFLILPEFLNHPSLMAEDGSALRRFICGSAKGDQRTEDYLLFHLQALLPARNLLENMIWSSVKRDERSQTVNQATMAVLLMELLNDAQYGDGYDASKYEKQIVRAAFRYLAENYPTATLEEFSSRLKQPVYSVSRIFKRHAKATFKECLQDVRLKRAAYLLAGTMKPVEEIIVEVGYENSSYFHKLFKKKYKMTPKHYRDWAREAQLSHSVEKGRKDQ